MRRPNVLFIISDDTELGYLGFSGGRALTPNLDGLAREGVVFNRHYTATAVCTASRYCYLTGRYASRTAEPTFAELYPPPETPLVHFHGIDFADEDHVGTLLGRAGYRTGFVGKIHVEGQRDYRLRDRVPADADPYDPAVIAEMRAFQRELVDEVKSRGFDYAASIAWGNLPSGRAGGVHNLEWTTKGGLDFLDSVAGGDQPWFLHVGTSVSHGPSHLEALEADPRLCYGGTLDSPIEEIMPPRDTIVPRLKQAGIPVHHRTAGCTWLDDAVGALVDKLKEIGQYENTLIVYATDHNEIRKATLYERGVHIPMMMHWPGHVVQGVACDELTENVDITPTVLDVCGVRPPRDTHHDGISLRPVLEGTGGLDRDELYLEIGLSRGVVTGKWKYIAIRYPKRYRERLESGEADKAYDHMGNFHHLSLLSIKHKKHYWDYDQLYDLDSDPDEEHNLAFDPAFADVLADMRSRLRRHLGTMHYDFDLEDTAFFETETFKRARDAHQAVGPETIPWYREEDYVGELTFPPVRKG